MFSLPLVRRCKLISRALRYTLSSRSISHAGAAYLQSPDYRYDWLFTIYMGKPVGSQFGMRNTGLVNFALGPH